MTNICSALDSCRFRWQCVGKKSKLDLLWLCSVFRIIKGQGIDIKSLSSRSVLTVTNMTEDRYGNYTCVASNKLGTANASVPLTRKLSFYLLVVKGHRTESVLWVLLMLCCPQNRSFLLQHSWNMLLFLMIAKYVCVWIWVCLFVSVCF